MNAPTDQCRHYGPRCRTCRIVDSVLVFVWRLFGKEYFA